MPTNIRSDLPVPQGKESPYGVLGRLITFLKERKPGESFEYDDCTTTIYRAAERAHVVIKRRKRPDGQGWIYWRVS